MEETQKSCKGNKYTIQKVDNGEQKHKNQNVSRWRAKSKKWKTKRAILLRTQMIKLESQE